MVRNVFIMFPLVNLLPNRILVTYSFKNMQLLEVREDGGCIISKRD